MENLHEDEKVFDLLKKIKGSNGAYPADMLAARRRAYLKQMANVGLGIGLGAGLSEALKGVGSNGAGTAAAATSKVLEIVLITALAIEAGTATYLYRDQIAGAIRSYTSTPGAVQKVSPPSSDEFSFISPTLAVGTPVVTASATPSGTPFGTPITVVVAGTGQDNNNQTSSDLNSNDAGGTTIGVNVNATPGPNGNQGNHYGLTPKPERTKENNGQGGGDGSNDNGVDNNTDGGGGNKNKP